MSSSWKSFGDKRVGSDCFDKCENAIGVVEKMAVRRSFAYYRKVLFNNFCREDRKIFAVFHIATAQTHSAFCVKIFYV